MNYKKVTVLVILLTLCSYYFIGQRVQDHRVVEENPSVSNRIPAAIKRHVKKVENPDSELRKSGLASEKVEAILQLQNFHLSSPAFTEENMRKREKMLDLLVHNPKETVLIFSQLMRTLKDDSLKGFLLNLSMNSSLEDEEKAAIFLSRLQAKVAFSKEGLVPDEEISFMISISHLSRLENAEVINHTQEQLKADPSLNMSKEFRQIYKDYFNESL